MSTESDTQASPGAERGRRKERRGTVVSAAMEKTIVVRVDIVKSHQINDMVLAQFFPCLIPGWSVVIQQDNHWGYAPWIHITMELFADYFEILDWMPNGSVAMMPVLPQPTGIRSIARVPPSAK